MIISIQGLDKVLSAMVETSKIDMMPAIKKAARFVQSTAKDLVAVDTGILKGSIKVKSLPKQQAAIIGTNVEYAPYQEFGTRKMKAHPFLGPAITINKSDIQRTLKKYFKEQMAKTVKGEKSDTDSSGDN